MWFNSKGKESHSPHRAISSQIQKPSSHLVPHIPYRVLSHSGKLTAVTALPCLPCSSCCGSCLAIPRTFCRCTDTIELTWQVEVVLPRNPHHLHRECRTPRLSRMHHPRCLTPQARDSPHLQANRDPQSWW